jgi:uncharacterized protein
MRFSWEDAKNRSNQKKHDGISFEMAAHVFADPLRVTRQDRVEGGEARWQTIGTVSGVIMLLVAHTIIDDDTGMVEDIGIISARRATARERKQCENENG